MTNDPEAQVRDRLRRAELPTAPEALRARLAAVVVERAIPRARTGGLGRQGRLLLPIAAVLLIGGAAILGGGGGPRPPTATSSPGWDDPTPHARLDVDAAVFQWCSPGGCEFQVTLDGPDDAGIVGGRVAFAELGSRASIQPALPSLLATGAYILRAEIHVIGDAIPEGASGPPDLGTTATCESGFIVHPGATLVSVTMGFWLDRCSVGTTVTADPRKLASLAVIPTVKGACGAADGGCDYRLALSGAINSTWSATTQTVLPSSQLVINALYPWAATGQYTLVASAHRMSREPEPGAGHQQELGVAAGCSATFLVDEDTTHVDIGVVFEDESCTIDTATQPPTEPRPTFTTEEPSATYSFTPPYGDQPPAGANVLVAYAQLSPDRRRVLVDFVSNGSSRGEEGCTTNVAPWVSIDGDTLQIALARASTPVPTACQPVEVGGSLVRYDVALPGVFLGSTYQDLSNGDLYGFP